MEMSYFRDKLREENGGRKKAKKGIQYDTRIRVKRDRVKIVTKRL